MAANWYLVEMATNEAIAETDGRVMREVFEWAYRELAAIGIERDDRDAVARYNLVLGEVFRGEADL